MGKHNMLETIFGAGKRKLSLQRNGKNNANPVFIFSFILF